uniref:ATP synthase complex subunit 8 n=1 Tax=Macrosaldula sp. PJ-2017 TaxID=2021942 RepID=A0A343ISC9_9HEMI|nr:ATP synthase F0 subunit 8 [Macrosaldula sp. PJ-2017]AST10154.1 ATP synthase F0 subunit 8 [Macrosaldula sp. PJ-2017]
MPQMAPMWWTMLMMFFIICFLMVAVKNYFIVKYSPKQIMMSSKDTKQVSWKW